MTVSFDFASVKLVTYTICNEQDGDRKQVIVLHHTKLVFHPVQSGIANGNSVHETDRGD